MRARPAACRSIAIHQTDPRARNRAIRPGDRLTSPLLLCALPAAMVERLGLPQEKAMWAWLAGGGLLVMISPG